MCALLKKMDDSAGNTKSKGKTTVKPLKHTQHPAKVFNTLVIQEKISRLLNCHLFFMGIGGTAHVGASKNLPHCSLIL